MVETSRRKQHKKKIRSEYTQDEELNKNNKTNNEKVDNNNKNNREQYHHDGDDTKRSSPPPPLPPNHTVQAIRTETIAIEQLEPVLDKVETIVQKQVISRDHIKEHHIHPSIEVHEKIIEKQVNHPVERITVPKQTLYLYEGEERIDEELAKFNLEPHVRQQIKSKILSTKHPWDSSRGIDDNTEVMTTTSTATTATATTSDKQNVTETNKLTKRKKKSRRSKRTGENEQQQQQQEQIEQVTVEVSERQQKQQELREEHPGTSGATNQVTTTIHPEIRIEKEIVVRHIVKEVHVQPVIYIHEPRTRVLEEEEHVAKEQTQRDDMRLDMENVRTKSMVVPTKYLVDPLREYSSLAVASSRHGSVPAHKSRSFMQRLSDLFLAQRDPVTHRIVSSPFTLRQQIGDLHLVQQQQQQRARRNQY